MAGPARTERNEGIEKNQMTLYGGIVQLIGTPVPQEAAGSSPVAPADVPHMSPFDREERSLIAGYCEFRFARHRDSDSRTSFHITPEGRQVPPRHLQARRLAKGGP